MTVTDEQRQTLWLLTVAPVIWAAHFLLSYITAAVWCTRYTSDGRLGPVPSVVALGAGVALAAIAAVAWIGWRKHSYGDGSIPHDADSPEDRHRFLGLATLLLSALSALATIYVAASAFFFGTCR
jgi:hypothetical protein